MGASSIPPRGAPAEGGAQLDGIMCRADSVGTKYQSHTVTPGASNKKTSLRNRKKFTKEYGRVVRRVQRFKEASQVRESLGPSLSEKKAIDMDKNLSAIRADILKTDIPALLRLAGGNRSFLCMIAAPFNDEDMEERKHMVKVLKSWVEDVGSAVLDDSLDDGRSDTTVGGTSESSSGCVQATGTHGEVRGESQGQPSANQSSPADKAGDNSTDVEHDSEADAVLADSAMKADVEGLRRLAAQQERLQAIQRREELRQMNGSCPSESASLPKSGILAEECAPPTPPRPDSSSSREPPTSAEQASRSDSHPMPGSRQGSKLAPTKLFGNSADGSKATGTPPVMHSDRKSEGASSVEAQVAEEAARRAEALKKSREQSQRAREELRRKQEEQQKRQSDLWESKPGDAFSDVAACVAKLQVLKGDAEAFVDLVYKDYPPKDGRTKYDRGNLKKTVQRAITHYHPDKQDEAAHGADWITICDEICKELTRIYTKM